MMHVLQARQTHQYSFRTGKWATVIGAAMIKPDDDCELRPCFIVAFPDGVFDYWAIDDPDAMTEFRAAALASAPVPPKET